MESIDFGNRDVQWSYHNFIYSFPNRNSPHSFHSLKQSTFYYFKRYNKTLNLALHFPSNLLVDQSIPSIDLIDKPLFFPI